MNPLPLGSYYPAITIEKWSLMTERDRLFNSYCECLDKLMIWESTDAYDRTLGQSRKTRQESLYTVREIIRNTMADLSSRLIDLDDQITDMGRIEPDETFDN